MVPTRHSIIHSFDHSRLVDSILYTFCVENTHMCPWGAGRAVTWCPGSVPWAPGAPPAAAQEGSCSNLRARLIMLQARCWGPGEVLGAVLCFRRDVACLAQTSLDNRDLPSCVTHCCDCRHCTRAELPSHKSEHTQTLKIARTRP